MGQAVGQIQIGESVGSTLVDKLVKLLNALLELLDELVKLLDMLMKLLDTPQHGGHRRNCSVHIFLLL